MCLSCLVLPSTYDPCKVKEYTSCIHCDDINIHSSTKLSHAAREEIPVMLAGENVYRFKDIDFCHEMRKIEYCHVVREMNYCHVVSEVNGL